MKNGLTKVFLPALNAKTIVTVRLLKQLKYVPAGTPIFCDAEELTALENNEVEKIYGYSLINSSYEDKIVIRNRSHVSSAVNPAFIENIDVLLGKDITATQLKTISEKAKINFPLCLLFDVDDLNNLEVFVNDALSQLYSDYKYAFTFYASVANAVQYDKNKKYAFLLSILDVKNSIIDYDARKIDGLIILLDFVQLDKNDEVCKVTKVVMHILSNYKENIVEIDGEQLDSYRLTNSIEHIKYAKYLLKRCTDKKKEPEKCMKFIYDGTLSMPRSNSSSHMYDDTIKKTMEDTIIDYNAVCAKPTSIIESKQPITNTADITLRGTKIIRNELPPPAYKKSDIRKPDSDKHIERTNYHIFDVGTINTTTAPTKDDTVMCKPDSIVVPESDFTNMENRMYTKIKHNKGGIVHNCQKNIAESNEIPQRKENLQTAYKKLEAQYELYNSKKTQMVDNYSELSNENLFLHDNNKSTDVAVTEGTNLHADLEFLKTVKHRLVTEEFHTIKN